MVSNILNIIYEDNHLLVVNKPAGMLTQGDITGDRSLLDHGKDYIKTKYQKPGNVFLGVVHRLDRPVSGIVLLAKTSKALTRLNKQFQEREIKKTYWAIVAKKPASPSGELVHYLIKDQKKNITAAYDKHVSNSKKAVLKYNVINQNEGFYLLEIEPLTGRPHQIRVQLAQIGLPIKGDLKYGFKASNEDGNISLYARHLSFIHPVKKEQMNLTAPIPETDIWQKIKI